MTDTDRASSCIHCLSTAGPRADDDSNCSECGLDFFRYMNECQWFRCEHKGCFSFATSMSSIAASFPEWDIGLAVFACEKHRPDLERDFGESRSTSSTDRKETPPPVVSQPMSLPK